MKKVDYAKESKIMKAAAKKRFSSWRSQQIKPQELAELLRETGQSDLPEDQRLVLLGYEINKSLGWKKACELYEQIMLAVEPDERYLQFGPWFVLADFWLAPNSPLTIPEKCCIANDRIELIGRAIALNPENAGLFVILCTCLIEHPDREISHLADAELAINQALHVAVQTDDEINALLARKYKAVCLMKQERWQNALDAFSDYVNFLDRSDLEELKEVQQQIDYCLKMSQS